MDVSHGVTLAIEMTTATSPCNMISFSDFLLGENLTFSKKPKKNMDQVNSWKWVLEKCEHDEIDPLEFMSVMKVKNVGFVGDNFNENFVVSLMRVLRVADLGSKKWKRNEAWRRGYFPKFNATVWYHRAALLGKYKIHWIALILNKES
nr:protein trichome birefringence-like 12 [Tanacetum cinerariifolium]